MRTVLMYALLVVAHGLALAGSDTPPKGPPWQRDLLAAHEQALTQGTPIFLYFTKTY